MSQKSCWCFCYCCGLQSGATGVGVLGLIGACLTLWRLATVFGQIDDKIERMDQSYYIDKEEQLLVLRTFRASIPALLPIAALNIVVNAVLIYGGCRKKSAPCLGWYYFQILQLVLFTFACIATIVYFWENGAEYTIRPLAIFLILISVMQGCFIKVVGDFLGELRADKKAKRSQQRRAVAAAVAGQPAPKAVKTGEHAGNLKTAPDVANHV